MPSLTWLTRDQDLRRAGTVPYRLLEADPALSHGDPTSGNMLIQGDNLDALKALLPYYKGHVKCIYIDPPYNTRSAISIHYDDNLEHTQWLAMIYPRLELLRDLLAEDGSIWVSMDDNEGHYLKVIMDEVFGRRNFIDTVIWEKRILRETLRDNSRQITILFLDTPSVRIGSRHVCRELPTPMRFIRTRIKTLWGHGSQAIHTPTSRIPKGHT